MKYGGSIDKIIVLPGDKVIRDGKMIDKIPIQKKKDFYVIKNGYGTGKATDTFLTLKECLIELEGSGWGEIVSYK